MGMEQDFVAHRDARRFDAAWCVADALVALKRASPDVHTFHAGHKRGLTKAAHPIPWRELAHPDELVALFAAAPMQGERPTGFAGIRRKDVRDMRTDALLVSKLLAYVATVLDVAPPELYILDDDDGPALEVFKLRDGKDLVPAMVCRPKRLSGHSEKHIAFLAAHVMTALRSADGVARTALRAGAVLCGDLSVALSLTPKHHATGHEAHGDLIAFWTSEAHFSVRQQMKLAIADPLGATPAPTPSRPPTQPPVTVPQGTLLEQFEAHKAAKRWDEAWCLAHALVATGEATQEIADYDVTFERKRAPLGPLSVRSLQHPGEDLTLTLELAKSWSTRALPHAKTLAAAGLSASQRVTIDSDDPNHASIDRMVRQLATLLDMKMPACFFAATPGPVVERVLLVDGGEPFPALVVRNPRAHEPSEVEAAMVQLVVELVQMRMGYRLRHVDPSLPASWCAAVDATARRAALVLHGLQAALRVFPADAHADLLAFWTSDLHVRIRRETFSP